MSVNLIYREIGDVVILDLSGQITMGDGTVSLRNIIRKLAVCDKKKVLLNMQHISYIDSSGLGELVSGLVFLENRGIRLKLLQLTKKTGNFLQSTRLHNIFEVFNEESEAVESFNFT